MFNRRLPIYFVLDISESMAGSQLESLQKTINQLVANLRASPEAIDTVHISIIAFAGRVRTLVPLTELYSFYPPTLPLGAGTSIGAALDFTAAEIDRNMIVNTPGRRGDYKPIVYFLSDGSATDDVIPAIERWKQNMRRKCLFIAIGIGKFADLSIFRPITNEIFRLENTRDQDFSQFVQWISQSITMQSNSAQLGQSGEKVSLEKAQQHDVMKIIYDQIDAAPQDDNFVILSGCCSQKKRPYLLKFIRCNIPSDVRQQLPNLPDVMYNFDYITALDETYYEWSDSRLTLNMINVNALIGGGDCPHCDNPYSMAWCQCGQMICATMDTPITCPRCQKIGMFTSSDDNSAGFQVNTSMG